jgi:tetratricopeptide (TPR) repeat protein
MTFVDGTDRAEPPRERWSQGRAEEAAEASERERACGDAAIGRREISLAVACLLRAIRVAEGARLPVHAARARGTLATALAARGDFAGADRQAERAAAVLRGHDLARLTAQKANVDYARGRLIEALKGYRQALPALRRAGDVLWEAIVTENRGLILAHQGAFASAVIDLERSGKLFESIGEHRLVADVQVNLAWLAARRGDVPAALARFDRADEYFQREGGSDPAALFDRCEALLAAHLATEARRTAAEAVERLGREGVAWLVAEAHLRLSEAALLEGDAPAAGAAATAALRALSRQRRPSFVALARYASLRAAWMGGDRSKRLVTVASRVADDLASTGWLVAALDARLIAAQLALGAGQVAVARHELAQTRATHRRGPAHVRSRLWHGEALLRLAEGDRRGADTALRAGMRVLETHRAVLGATELRAHTSAHATDLAGLGLRLALEDGSPERTLRWAERWRAGSLHLRPVRPPSDPTLAGALSDLREVSGELTEAAGAGRDTSRLLARQAAIEEVVRRRSRHAPGKGLYRALPAPTIAMCRAALGPRALVELIACDGMLHAVVLAGGRPRLRALGSVDSAEAELHSMRFAMRRLATRHGSSASLQAARNGVVHAARNLDRQLLEPLRRDIGDRDLVVVPTGALHSVPWSLLPSTADRPVSVAPSAALWYRAASAEAAPVSAEARVALVAGPGLPGADAEVSELRSSYPHAQWLVGAEASVGAVLTAIDGALLAHVAAHGRFRSDNPLFSCLELADGPLTVYDLETLGRSPTTLVLSACESGLSEVRPGDELMGLAAALFTLGARCLIATVVPIEDAVAGPLMVRLHDALLSGMEPAAALAWAQAKSLALEASAGSSGSFVCFGAG